MKYEISVSPRAQKEIENAVDYYISNSNNVARRFIQELDKVYTVLSSNPHFEIRYKNVRSFKIRKFPYSLFFVVDENTRKNSGLFSQQKESRRQAIKNLL